MKVPESMRANGLSALKLKCESLCGVNYRSQWFMVSLLTYAVRTEFVVYSVISS